MSWRTVVITKPSKLDLSMGYLVVRSVAETVKIHLNEISILMVENTATSLTAALLSALAQQKIKVIFCDSKRNPQSELVPYHGSHDCSLKWKKQIQWESFYKEAVWTEIVAEKIRNQRNLLARYNFPQASLLDTYLSQLAWNDETNREGHAAKVYFNALFGVTFSRTQEHPINAALNYGYSLILSCFNREVVACGYHTELGLFHDNMFNPYNLSCDLMEPFRPLIDAAVFEMKPECFEKEEKRKLLEILYHEVFIEERRQTCLNAIKVYCQSIFRALEEKDVAQIRFMKDELSIYENNGII